MSSWSCCGADDTDDTEEIQKSLTLAEIWSWTEAEIMVWISERCREAKLNADQWLPIAELEKESELQRMNHLRLNAVMFARSILPKQDFQWARRSYWGTAVMRSKNLLDAQTIITRETGWRP